MSIRKTNDKLQPLISADEIKACVEGMGAKITADFRNTIEPLVFVCVLRGACIFFADLVRAVPLDITMEFIKAQSYFDEMESCGEVEAAPVHDLDVRGKHIVLVEDILDTGNTLACLKKLLLEKKPASIKIAALLDKPTARKTDINADYVGFSIKNEFVVGYGLDCAQLYRNLPAIYSLRLKP